MFWRRRKPEDFEAEIQAHLHFEAEQLKAQGLNEEYARRAARRAFGNVTRTQERFFESGRWLFADLLRDVRYGMRMLAANPGFTFVAVLILALGIGANTAIFSLLNAVLLRNLPVEHPHELVLFGKGEWVGSQNTLPDRSWQLFSYKFFREFRQKNQIFSDVAAVNSIEASVHGRVGSSAALEKINIDLVSGSYFHTLGVKPSAGRLVSDFDDQTAGAHPVAVASYQWWKRRFASGTPILDAKVTISSVVYTVVGVAPPGFFGVTVGQAPDLWIPLAMEKQISPGWNGLDQNLFQSLYIFARRKPGISVAQAAANTNLLFKQILREYAGPQPSRKDLEAIRNASIDLTPAATGLSQLRLQFSSPLKILMVVVSIVLLIACANVANLLMARAVSRRREIAVRMSLGARRSRLIRQLLVESGLLGLSGGLLGAIFAWNVSHLLLSLISPDSAAIPVNVAPDAQVFALTFAIAVLAVLLFGTLPAFHSTRLQLTSSLKEGRGIVTTTLQNLFSRGLIAGQVALSLVLLVGAGLFLHSFANLMDVNTGFDKQNVVAVEIDPGSVGYQVDARLESMMHQVEERVDTVPGVHDASFAFSLFGGGWTDPVTVPGRPPKDSDPDVFQDIVGPQYLAAMKTPIVAGRALNDRDNLTGPKVAVINEAMVRAYFAGGSAIGRTFSVGNEGEWQNIQVVGIAKDAKYMSLRERERPAAFYPHAQHGMFLYLLIARYTGNSKFVFPAIKDAVHSVNPNLPIGNTTTFAAIVDSSVLNQRLVTQLSTFFGLLAALLSCVGIYGVVSYGVARRTNEFGLRMALGAERGDVLWMVIRETSRILAIGLAAGLLIALACGRLIQSQLFGLKFSDPFTILIALAVMLSVALFAAYLPARRATHIDPAAALRNE
ncbi:MAG: ABC transporter permease [Bryobacteraceae bacterium]